VSQDLPDFQTVSADVLYQIAAAYGCATVSTLERPGIANRVYQLGDNFILRAPRDSPEFIEALEREAIAVPAARAAGVRTPALVAFDESCTLLPVPFAVYERVHGRPLEHLELPTTFEPSVLQEIGRDLARLHSGVEKNETTEINATFLALDPKEAVAGLAEEGTFTGLEATWLNAILERLTPAIEANYVECLRRGDTQATNIMVSSTGMEYRALIDWGNATWGDPAQDFNGLPLRAIPTVLDGYRTIAKMENAEARILWWQFQNALYLLKRPPLPELPTRSWAERPLAQLLETLRFLMAPTSEDWKSLLN
jgi:aminoglycoside phosphotransferase (APT) family kinase protein